MCARKLGTFFSRTLLSLLVQLCIWLLLGFLFCLPFAFEPECKRTTMLLLPIACVFILLISVVILT